MKLQTIIIIILVVLLLLTTGFIIKLINSPNQITGNVISEQIKQTKSSTNIFPEKAFVSKVIDGDTVIINGESVRLLGMDTDERGYPCYKEAKKRIEEILLDKEVILEKDNEDKDQYDRRLRYIFLNGNNINLQLVKEGLAVARFSPENQKYKIEILEAEKYARENKLGCKWREEAKAKETKREQEIKTESKKEAVIDEEEQEVIDISNYTCSTNTYNCGDFKTHKEAQAVFEACGGKGNDIHRLDQDGDGDACETLA